MPAKKKTSPIRKPQVTSSNGPSYDTLMIITTLLLLFLYPVGLILMWGWMKQWPLWLKIVISLPLLISFFFVMLIVLVVGNVVHQQRSTLHYGYGMQIGPTAAQKSY